MFFFLCFSRTNENLGIKKIVAGWTSRQEVHYSGYKDNYVGVVADIWLRLNNKTMHGAAVCEHFSYY